MNPSPTTDRTDAHRRETEPTATPGGGLPGFSLVELVIVIVIIGVIAAIAVPRISRGANGAIEAALRANLRTLRGAIELYAAEHGGLYPSIIPATVFEDQMLTYSDYDGNTNAAKTAPFIYGPYLVAIPTLQAGEGATNGKKTKTVGTIETSSTAWVYDKDTGGIYANTGTLVDKSVTLLSAY